MITRNNDDDDRDNDWEGRMRWRSYIKILLYPAA